MPSPLARKPAPPSRTFTPEEMRDLGRRARVASARLAEATERMNESLCLVEDVFLERLKDARGRVELRRSTKGRAWVEFLVYKDGELFVESNRSGPRFTMTHVLDTNRESRMLVCHKIPELWVECGGKLPRTDAPGG